jgi:hypothetical protein
LIVGIINLPPKDGARYRVFAGAVQCDLAALRQAIRTGDDSGANIPAADVFAEFRQIIAERRARA